MIDRLLGIDRRIIFAAVFLGVAIPLLTDVQFPVKPSKQVRAVYDEIERVAGKEDPLVLLSFAYGASTEPEMQPMAKALLRHLFSRDVGVVAICLWPEAPGLTQLALEETAAEYTKKYGEDYAFMGYKPGTYSVIINMGQDFADAFPKDNWGTPTAKVPLTAGVAGLSDFDLVIDLAAGDSIEFWWLPFGQERYSLPFAAGCTAVMAPDLYPFLQSGQMRGLIGGLVGAAEYEALIGHPGGATAGMSPQSVTHLIIVFFILVGNAAYFAARHLQRRRPE